MNKYINKVELEVSLGFNINRVAILFRRELIRCLKEYDITPEQWQVLMSLWKYKMLNQVEIAHITYQDAPSISRMINRMVKNGWVSKSVDQSDARVTRITLTPSGDKLKNKLPQKLIKHFNNILINFPKNKQDHLLKLLIDLKSCFE